MLPWDMLEVDSVLVGHRSVLRFLSVRCDSLFDVVDSGEYVVSKALLERVSW
eukprot:c15269_g3_i1 orf=177-332(+)